MNLRLRIALALAAVATVVVVAVGISVHRTTETELVGEVDADLLARVRPLDPAAVDRIPLERFRDLSRREAFAAGQRVDPFVALVGFDALVRVLDAEGNERGRLAGAFLAPNDPALLAAAREGPVLHDGSTLEGRARVVTVGLPNDAFIQLARPLDEVDAVLADLRRRSIVIGAVAIAAAAVAGWFIAGATARPIRRLSDAAEEVARTGDLRHPVGGGGTDEVGRLATSLTTMLEALDASRGQQHRLVMDASHELRTPLTSLRTNVDVLRRGHALSDEQRAALVDDVDAELTELSDLVAELVDLAADVRSEENVTTLTLREVTDPVVERARRRSGREIVIDERRQLPVEARPGALGRAVKNLVDTAVKFSPPGTPIRVEIDGGSLVVHDQGSGIPPGEREAVFDRFHRLDPARPLPGSGLGLAIVRQIVEAHDGTVKAAASPDGGAAVGFTLPTVDETAA